MSFWALGRVKVLGRQVSERQWEGMSLPFVAGYTGLDVEYQYHCQCLSSIRGLWTQTFVGVEIASQPLYNDDRQTYRTRITTVIIKTSHNSCIEADLDHMTKAAVVRSQAADTQS